MKTNELVRFLKDLVPPLTPVLILAAFAVFQAGISEPAPTAVVTLPLAPFAELAAAVPTALYFTGVREGFPGWPTGMPPRGIPR